jgi:putative thioredoxin
MQQSRDFSLRGAVDLGARQAAQRRQQAAQSQGAGDQPANVIDVTDQSFTVDVVERSRSVPVVMDLWAEWCGPCKQLSPVLEKLADEADGAWILAKVDVDANPQLSAALGVQSIPMVVAVVGGQVVDAFLGAQPEANVRDWISQIMQVAGQLGLPGADPAAADADAAEEEQEAGATTGPQPAGAASGPQPAGRGPAGPGPGRAAGPGRAPGPAGPGMGRPGADPFADPGFADAQQALEQGDFDAAAAAFEKVLASAPGHPAATMGLAQVDLIRRVNSYDRVKAQQDAKERPGDPEAQARVADIDVAFGRVEDGFDRLLETVRRTSGEERNQARLQLLRLFEVFPPGDQKVSKARARLSSLLF